MDFVVEREALLERGLAHHRSGNFTEASKCYRSFLRKNPGHPQGLYLFGCLEYQTGDNAAAAELLRQAIAAAPHTGDYHNVLGCALTRLEKFEDAEQSLERAIALDNRAEFHSSLGTLRKSQNRLPEAIAAYREALRLDASVADAHYNLGNAFRSNGNGEEAAQSFHRALELNAGHFHALAALGQMSHAAGRIEEAAEYLKKALAVQPQDTDVLCELGDIWQESGDLGEAVALYQRALKVNPRLARAWYSGGCVEIARREYVPAAMCFEKAVDLQPDWLEARHNLARALYELGQVSAALSHFRWCAAQPQEASAQARAMIAVIIPGVPEADNQAVLDARRSWAERDLAGRTAGAEPAARSASGQPLRIGYVSSFFHRDNWMKPVWGLMNQHDRGIVEVNLFSDAPATSIQHGYRPHPQDRFFDTTNLSNEALAALVREAGIDILVDLNGYSNMRRLPLFSLRPCPIAIGWFNLYATSENERLRLFDWRRIRNSRRGGTLLSGENPAGPGKLFDFPSELSGTASGGPALPHKRRRHVRISRLSVQDHERSSRQLESHSGTGSEEFPHREEFTSGVGVHAPVSSQPLREAWHRTGTSSAGRAGRALRIPEGLRPNRHGAGHVSL